MYKKNLEKSTFVFHVNEWMNEVWNKFGTAWRQVNKIYFIFYLTILVIILLVTYDNKDKYNHTKCSNFSESFRFPGVKS